MAVQTKEVAYAAVGTVDGAGQGQAYKFHLRSRQGGYEVDKADPFAFHSELPPRTGSVGWPCYRC